MIHQYFVDDRKLFGITQLTEELMPSYTDVAYICTNPSTTPTDRQVSIQHLVMGGAGQGACSGIIDANLTANKALQADANGKISASTVDMSQVIVDAATMSSVYGGYEAQFIVFTRADGSTFNVFAGFSSLFFAKQV